MIDFLRVVLYSKKEAEASLRHLTEGPGSYFPGPLVLRA